MHKFFQYNNLHPLFTIFLFALLAVFLTACSPEIGDQCERSNQCPPGASCDVTVPDGYCLIRQCEPNSCPDEAICVNFDRATSYCLKWCNDNGDCRSGHSCIREEGQEIGYCFLPGS